MASRLQGEGTTGRVRRGGTEGGKTGEGDGGVEQGAGKGINCYGGGGKGGNKDGEEGEGAPVVPKLADPVKVFCFCFFRERPLVFQCMPGGNRTTYLENY